MTIDEKLIGICPTLVNEQPSHCPKCGCTDSFSQEYIMGQKTGDYLCNNCRICIENYVHDVMKLKFGGTPLS